jgi:hypothetical protein
MSAIYLDELKARNRSHTISEEEGSIQLETFPKPSQISRRRKSNIEKDYQDTNSIEYFEVGETSLSKGNQNVTKIVQRDTIYIYKNGYFYVCMAGLAIFITAIIALNDYILISYTNINWL